MRAQQGDGPKSRVARLHFVMKQDGGGEECVDIEMTEPGEGTASCPEGLPGVN